MFNYDLLGNRDSTTDSRTGGVNYTYASNWVNEYTDITPASFDPDNDPAGNLIQDKSGYQYTYDYENRLTQIARPDDTVVATFAYDALGRRIEKVDTIAGITTRFYYDDQRIALQTSVSGGTETDWKYFVYGNYIDEVLVMSVIPAQAGIQDFYYGHDHLYSPVALFESDGDLVERYEYDVYGQMRRLNPDFTAFSGTEAGNPYYFTGRELDTLDAGSCTLYYYRARSYDPQTGRFLQRDPLKYINGVNLYSYGKTNPERYRDPLGLSCVSTCSQGDIDYKIKNSVVTYYHTKPGYDDLYNSAEAAKLGMDASDWGEVVAWIAMGHVTLEEISGFLISLGYGYASSEMAGKVLDIIGNISDILKESGYDLYSLLSRYKLNNNNWLHKLLFENLIVFAENRLFMGVFSKSMTPKT